MTYTILNFYVILIRKKSETDKKFKPSPLVVQSRENDFALLAWEQKKMAAEFAAQYQVRHLEDEEIWIERVDHQFFKELQTAYQYKNQVLSLRLIDETTLKKLQTD